MFDYYFDNIKFSSPLPFVELASGFVDFTAVKDLVKHVPQFLEPFVMVESGITKCSEVMTNTQDNESIDVVRFVNETLNNHSAYHLGHLLLIRGYCV